MQELIIATYNIQLATNPQKIVSNIALLAKQGVTVFCLQEIVYLPDKERITDLILKRLGNDWKAACSMGKELARKNLGNCIIWNAKILHEVKREEFLLPKLKQLAVHEMLFTKLVGGITVPLQRRTISCTFQMKNKKFRVTSLHLDHVGGSHHRIRQLNYFLHQRVNEPIDIICGDFNNFDLLQTGYETTLLHKNFGNEFIDASKNVGWTSGLQNMNLIQTAPIIKWLIKRLPINRRLDYIWVKNVKVVDCYKVVLLGSDHFPIIAELNV